MESYRKLQDEVVMSQPTEDVWQKSIWHALANKWIWKTMPSSSGNFASIDNRLCILTNHPSPYQRYGVGLLSTIDLGQGVRAQ